ncbi:GNAT family N-acetyltransferase [Streptomyces sp. AC627_RSS907]|uniref:GNAT family N-acetyltransferase n=1 Tax=Streptomyces sp. AC627_RSS907 TaxID=2823684 RepID=UPI0027E3E8D9|nr:GNAT family N-acetyltransferase [Streptomyces sp. AC627_RSS907]
MLRDGATTRTRLAATGDLPSVNALHARCSRQSLVLRYLSGRRRLSAAEWRVLTSPAAGLTWVTHPADEPDRVIAVTHVLHTERTPGLPPDRDAGPGPAELALLVDDVWQCRGLGSALTRQAVTVARQQGHSELHALVLADNRPALALARSLGATVTSQGSQCTVRLSLTRWDGTAPRLLRGADAGVRPPVKPRRAVPDGATAPSPSG